MRAHQIGHKILLFAEFFVDGGIFSAEGSEHTVLRLAHIAQNAVGDVLRRDLELPGYMELGQLAQEGRIRVGK